MWKRVPRGKATKAKQRKSQEKLMSNSMCASDLVRSKVRLLKRGFYCPPATHEQLDFTLYKFVINSLGSLKVDAPFSSH